MKSLFDINDNSEIINRIALLTIDSSPEWGKMTVNQMLAHCQEPLLVAFGNKVLKRTLVGFILGKMAKNKLLKDDLPFEKNMPTDKSFIVKSHHSFEIERNKLVSLIRRFAEYGPSGITQDPHPFFGRMSSKEWDKLQWKHIDHHLRQFGV